MPAARYLHVGMEDTAEINSGSKLKRERENETRTTRYACSP